MKSFLSLIVALQVIILPLAAQDKPKAEQKISRAPKFSAGLNYTFISQRMQLFSRTDHAIWQGLDYGTDTLTRDEVKSVNSIARYNSNINSLCLEFGMILLNRPDGHWFIDGKILLGVTKTYYETYNKNMETTDLKVSSAFSRPNAGLEFLFMYSFNPHWGVSMNPIIAFSWGTSTDITDNLDPSIPYFNESRKEKSNSLYSRITFLANYTYKTLTVSVGPGLYMTFNRRIYTVDKTNPENGHNFWNESKSVFYNNSIIDGCVSIDWRIIPALDVNLFCGFGQDVIVHPGIRYLF